MEINPASSSDINAVLAQMRQIRAQAQAGIGSAQGGEDVADVRGFDSVRESQGAQQSNFGGMLKSAIDSVNELQRTSSQTSTDFIEGRENNLVKVMLDSQKASVGFQAMVQVRNRMVSAYQDIMKMPI